MTSKPTQRSLTVGDILETADATSPMDMNNRDRFVVLYNKLHAIDQAGGHQSAYIEFYKKINLATIFNAGVAGTAADITTGSIYLVILGAMDRLLFQLTTPNCTTTAVFVTTTHK